MQQFPMESFWDNKYVFWGISFALATLVGILMNLMRRRQADQEKRQEKAEADINKLDDRLNRVIAEMPIQYTLRDEFLRVTGDMTRKLDKTNDMLNGMVASMSAIKEAVTGGLKNGN